MDILEKLKVKFIGTDKIPEMVNVNEEYTINGEFGIKNYISGTFKIVFRVVPELRKDKYQYVEDIKKEYVVHHLDLDDVDGVPSIVYSEIKDNEITIYSDYAYQIKVSDGVVKDEIIKEFLVNDIVEVLPETFINDLMYNSNPDFPDSVVLTIKIK